jgi:catechol 2,3-dioxygenase-like lactoylglutathione lyase family enzyme
MSPTKKIAGIEAKGVLHFSIVVSDLTRSQKFYTDLLGLTLVAAPPESGMVFLRAGSDHVILCEGSSGSAPNVGDTTKIHHAFRVDADRYEAAKTFLVSKGVNILFEEDRRVGVFVGKQFYFHDPDNNVLEISECSPPNTP